MGWEVQLFAERTNVLSPMVTLQDDLPSISISRLRASGAITAEMTRTTIGIADVEADVGLQLVRLANGGCPHCGRRARVLKLLDGCVLCWRCCHRRGARYHVWTVSPKRRAEFRIPKLRAMLESETPLRLKPQQLRYSKLARRKRLTASLRRAEYVVSKQWSG